jgi:hypothetical protein
MSPGKDVHPERFPIKPTLGRKGGSILWEDAQLIAIQVFYSTASNSTDWVFSMQQIAFGGGITAERMDGTIKQLVRGVFLQAEKRYLSGESLFKPMIITNGERKQLPRFPKQPKNQKTQKAFFSQGLTMTNTPTTLAKFSKCRSPTVISIHAFAGHVSHSHQMAPHKKHPCELE